MGKIYDGTYWFCALQTQVVAQVVNSGAVPATLNAKEL